MHRFSVLEQNHAQIPSVCFYYSTPPTNSSVGLNELRIRFFHHALEPFITDVAAIRSSANVQEVLRKLPTIYQKQTLESSICDASHFPGVTKLSGASIEDRLPEG